MTTRLTPYGSAEHAHHVSKVGTKKVTPLSLAERMPSPEIAAKVGTGSFGLGSGAIAEAPAFRILRLNAQD